MWSKVTAYMAEWWRTGLWLVLFFGVLALLGLFRIDQILPSLAPVEINITSLSVTDILKYPLFVHHLVAAKLLAVGGVGPLLAARLPNFLIFVISACGYYYIVNHWFSRKVAIMSTVLFATSSWMLHTTRLGTTDASYLLILLPIVGLLVLKQRRHSLQASLLLIGSGLVLLYVPGVLWFALPLIVWRRKQLIKSLRTIHPLALGFIGVISVVALLPLVVGMIVNPRLALDLAALPTSLSALSHIPGNALSALWSVFVSRDFQPLSGISTFAHTNYAVLIFTILGAYYLWQHRQLERSKALAVLLAGSLMFHAINPDLVPIAVLLPGVFLLVANGIAYLYEVWHVVFPKNPLAHRVAIVCLVLVLCSVTTYEIVRYFVAWPHSEAYTQIYQTPTD